MGQVLIIPIVNLIVLITDIAFNYNSYSITFSQRAYKLLNICPNFFRDGLFEHIWINSDVKVNIDITLEVQVWFFFPEWCAMLWLFFKMLLECYFHPYEIRPSRMMVALFFPVPFYWKCDIVNSFFIIFFDRKTFFSSIELMRLNNKHFFIASMINL